MLLLVIPCALGAEQEAGVSVTAPTAKPKQCPDKVPRAIVTHHKLGMTVASKLVSAVRVSTGCEIKLLSSGYAKKYESYLLVNLVQNPFDLLLSTYMHHKRGSDPWAKCPMVRDPKCVAQYSSNPVWVKNMDAVSKLYSYIMLFQNSTSTGGIRLRSPTVGESYSAYLAKCQLEKGLFATFLFDKFSKGIDGMQTTFNKVKGNKGHANICIDDVNVLDLSSSNKELSLMLNQLQFKSGMTFSTKMAKNHFLDHKMVSTYEKMKTALKDWDAAFNNNRLSLLEKLVGCGVNASIGTISPVEQQASKPLQVENAAKKTGFFTTWLSQKKGGG